MGPTLLGNEALGSVPTWVKRERLPARAIPGAKLYAVAGCLNCHVYLGAGSSNVGGRDLSHEGTRRSLAYLARYIGCPQCVHPSSPMPSFSALGKKNLHELAVFLAASKGEKR